MAMWRTVTVTRCPSCGHARLEAWQAPPPYVAQHRAPRRTLALVPASRRSLARAA